MERLKGKSGAGHFEVITAFVLFFTFVVFLLIFIKPYQTGTLRASVVAGLHDSFKEETQTPFTKFFIKAQNFPNEAECFYVRLDNRLFRFDITNSITKDLIGVDINSKTEPGDSTSKLIIADNDESHYVLLSPIFEDDSVECPLELNYELGNIDERNIISYNSLLNLKEEYQTDYENLKKKLNFPEAYDFSIVSEIINIEGIIPEEGDVIAQDFLEEVLFSNGTIINQRFTLKVW